MSVRSNKLIAILLPLVSVTGVYADTLAPMANQNNQKYVTSDSNSAQLTADQLGLMTGPLELGAAYSQLYGPIISGQYTLPFGMNDRQAVSIIGEAGPRQYRINGTYGIEFLKNHRIKASAEYLAQNILFNFNSGDSRQWVGQGAYGAAYQYVVPSKWLNAINVSSYYSNAQSKDLSTVIYTNSNNQTMANLRRIAGGQSFATAAGVEMSPWKWSNISAALNYDNVWYDTRYNTSSNNARGLGFTLEAEQLLAETLKVGGIASVRQVWNEFGGGISWLAPVPKGTALELGANVSYLQGKTTERNDWKGGLTLSYRWNGPKDGAAPVYQLTQTGKTDLADWVSTPAVYMAEVLAIADQMDIDPNLLFLSDVSMTYLVGQPIDIDLSQGATTFGGANTVYSNSGDLPAGVTLSAGGRITGTALQESVGSHLSSITLTQTGAQGNAFTSKPAKLTINIIDTNAIPKVNAAPKDLGAIPENSQTGQLSVADAFNVQMPQTVTAADAKKMGVPSDEVAGSHLTYLYDPAQALPEGVKSIQVDKKTGSVSIDAAVVNAQMNAKIKVVGQLVTKSGQAYKYEGSNNTADISFAIMPTEVTAKNGNLPDIAPEAEIVPVSLDNYFVNTAKTMTYTAAGELYGLTINGNTLQGKPTVAAGSYTVQIKGTNENQKSAISSLTFKVTAVALQIGNIPDQQGIVSQPLAPITVTATGGKGPLSYTTTTPLPSGVSINASTGVISGTPTVNGSFPVTVTVTDANNQTASTSFNIVVDDLPGLPTIDDQRTVVNQAITPIAVTATGGKGPLSYTTTTPLPTGVSIDKGTGTISGTPTVLGDFPVTVQVEDANKQRATTSFKVTVIDALPTISKPADQYDKVGTAVSHPITAQGQNITYTATGLPGGLSIDEKSGVISGTLATDATDVNTVTVTATNTGGSAQTSFTLYARPNIDPISDQQFNVGDTVNLPISAQGSNIQYITTALPAGLSLSVSGNTASIVGTPITPVINQGITVQVKNGGGAESVTFKMTINQNLAINNPGDQHKTVGDSINLPISATGKDLSYAATGLPKGLSIDPKAGSITGKLADDASDINKVEVTVSSGATQSIAAKVVSTSFTIYAGPRLEGPTGQVWSPMGGSAPADMVKGYGSNLTYTATGLPEGFSIESSTGKIIGTVLPKLYPSDTFPVTVSVKNGGGTAQVNFNYYIGVGITPVVTQASYTVNEPISVPVIGAGGSLTYSAVGLPDGLTINPKSGLITGTVTKATPNKAGTVYVTNTIRNEASSTVFFNVLDAVPTMGINGKLPHHPAVIDTGMTPLNAGSYFYGSAGGVISYAITGLPTGAAGKFITFDTKTGVLSGTPKCASLTACTMATGAARVTQYNLTVTATNLVNGKTAQKASSFRLCVAMDKPGVKTATDKALSDCLAGK